MDLKEKILDTENNKPDEMATSWITVDRQSALKAMNELSKIVAIAFAEWAAPKYMKFFDKWTFHCEDVYSTKNEFITSDELFHLFTQSKEYKELMDQK